ncbi:diguanylate cyclase [Starkeya koreensis]|uniref:Diguanylate cyclase n=1 Tax=Ancylobacter koreensis TaxID=266121 RepID=A0ABT0DQ28_9HYPH|nr:diguanylate cyclase [Ancylobacter koreensis]MCK0209373.1 diguanylate cyclase [Ancylobacter koreensis]
MPDRPAKAPETVAPFPGASGRRGGRRSIAGRQLVLFGVVVGVLLAAGVAFVLVAFRHAAIHRVDNELKRMALVLADQAERAFEALETAQNGILQELESAQVDTVDDLRDQKNRPDLRESLRQRIAGLAHVDVIALIDDKGDVIGHSHPVTDAVGNLSDRHFFTTLRDGPAEGRYVSVPLTDPDGTIWTVHVAQRVNAQDGTFLGVVLGAVRLRYFETLYGTVAATSGDVISLVHSDGDVLARYPALDGRPPDGGGNPLAASHRVADTGDDHARRIAIGPEAFSAAHEVSTYPVQVQVSRDALHVLGSWQQEAVVIILGAGLAELSLAGVVLLGVRQIRYQGRLAEMERERRTQHIRFATAMEHLNQGVCMLDPAGHIAVVNPRLRELLGLPGDASLVGLGVGAFARATVAAGRLAPSDIRGLRRAIAALPAQMPASLTLHLSDGRVFVVELDTTPDGGHLATVEDATERHRAEMRIQHLAHHDPLTGLANRTLFSQRLREAIGRDGAPPALLLLDLDHFKEVNDRFGHPVGDALLVAAADRLRGCLGPGDLAARLGGDEFAVLQAGSAQPEGPQALGDRLVEVLGAPYEIEGRHLVVYASVGSAVAGPGDDEAALMRQADLALYRAKGEGRGRHLMAGDA